MDVTRCSDSSEQCGNEITPLTCHGPPGSGSFNQRNSFLPCLPAVTGSGCKLNRGCVWQGWCLPETPQSLIRNTTVLVERQAPV